MAKMLSVIIVIIGFLVLGGAILGFQILQIHDDIVLLRQEANRLEELIIEQDRQVDNRFSEFYTWAEKEIQQLNNKINDLYFVVGGGVEEENRP